MCHGRHSWIHSSLQKKSVVSCPPTLTGDWLVAVPATVEMKTGAVSFDDDPEKSCTITGLTRIDMNAEKMADKSVATKLQHSNQSKVSAVDRQLYGYLNSRWGNCLPIIVGS